MPLRLIDAPEPRRVPSLTALREVEPSPWARRIATMLFTILIGTPFVLMAVPWRQSVSGVGRVVGYAPLDRQFNVEAPVGGRVREWYVIEGTRVKQGDRIARISDNDPQYLESLRNQLAAVTLKRDTATNEAEIYDDVTERIDAVREMAVRAAENNVEVAKQKVRSEEQELSAIEAALDADKRQYERLARLLPQGLTSRRDYELAEQKYRESAAKRLKAAAAVEGSKSDLEVKKAYLAEITAKSHAEFEKARAEVQKCNGKVAECNKEIQDLEVKIRRQIAQEVFSPRDGTILRLLVNQGTEQVKEGDAIAVLVPDAADLAVELWVDGNDAPLVHAGDVVRLQFEGWPAIQFTGWPSVAVGSFGGRVALVDAADNGKGKFRVLVRRDPDHDWPDSHHLRQGVRTKGWVLLREVTLGYEVWRRLNGFPQSLSSDEPAYSSTYGGKDSTATSYEPEKDKEKVKVKRPK